MDGDEKVQTVKVFSSLTGKKIGRVGVEGEEEEVTLPWNLLKWFVSWPTNPD